jgi:hypothetical protein
MKSIMRNHRENTHPVCVDEEVLPSKGSYGGKAREALPVVLEDG